MFSWSLKHIEQEILPGSQKRVPFLTLHALLMPRLQPTMPWHGCQRGKLQQPRTIPTAQHRQQRQHQWLLPNSAAPCPIL